MSGGTADAIARRDAQLGRVPPEGIIMRRANVAELADAQDLGSCPARGPGSTPGVRMVVLVVDKL